MIDKNQTLEKINECLNSKIGLYSYSKDKEIYCPMINGLTNLCLFKLGYKDLGKENNKMLLQSKLFDRENNLFYKGLKEGILDKTICAARNSIVALSLASTGHNNEAKKIMNALIQSPLFRENHFIREYKEEEINAEFIVHSNLWAILALSKLGYNKLAIKILDYLDNDGFATIDCKNWVSFSLGEEKSKEKTYFSDDLALAVIAYSNLGNSKRAKEILNSMLNGKMFDKSMNLFNRNNSESSINTLKSTYKNSLCILALKKCGFDKAAKNVTEGLIKYLYDSSDGQFFQSTKDKVKVPDNSALALIALEYR